MSLVVAKRAAWSDIPIHVIAHVLRQSYRFNLRCRRSVKRDPQGNIIKIVNDYKMAKACAYAKLSYVLSRPSVVIHGTPCPYIRMMNLSTWDRVQPLAEIEES